MGVAPIKILGKVWTDGKIAATLGGIRGGCVLKHIYYDDRNNSIVRNISSLYDILF
jgi:hypothetical protein